MAKSKFAAAPLPEEERGEYDRWLPDSHRKMIPLDDLEVHPENWELVGRIDPARRKGLVEDILKNGIRDDLHVWYRDGRLLIVSGGERFDIANELVMKTLPCIKKEFQTDSEVRRHIFAMNKHRKDVKLPPPDVMMSMFPPDEYPLMYADLRANYSYESEKTSGHITPVEREKAREKREKEREIQADLRKQAGELLGYTPEFTKQVVTKVAKKAKKKKAAKKRKLTTAEEKEREQLEKKLETLRAKMEKKEQTLEDLKGEIGELRKEKNQLLRLLDKLQ